MNLVRAIGAVGVLSYGAFAADVLGGDAKRGEQLFRTQQCIHCHSMNGRGGGRAPDLARSIDRNYNPAVMATLIWNHAPQMWAGMKSENLTTPQLSPDQAADLFAYFVSVRYFEKPGDAARGKQLFDSKKCAACHEINASKAAGAPPVAKWESLADPLLLAQQMWNHGAKMTAAFKERKIGRPTLTAQELTDLLVYLRNLPETRHLASHFSFSQSDSGAQTFQSKGCAECHTGKLALESRLHNQTLTGIAAAMWDHQAAMKQPPPQLSQEEMREIIGYIWARQYFGANGNAARGKRVFEEKHCASCHDDPASGAPKLAKGKNGYSAVVMVSALWGHGPRMSETMHQKNLEWPRFSAQQMSDLIAFLNSL